MVPASAPGQPGVMEELTRIDEMSLSGAALHGAPWRTASVSGGAVASASLLLGWILPGPADLTWALCIGIGVFALVAAIGAISRPHQGDRVTRQSRRWALQHPWRFALYPGLISAVLMLPVQLVIDREGLFGAVWDAFWGGVWVTLLTAVITRAMRYRAGAS